MKRPKLTKDMDSTVFLNYYYLKDELVAFCRSQKLSISGNKTELTNRIAYYLDTGKNLSSQSEKKRKISNDPITLDTLIETDFVCSQKHRAFFKRYIPSFSFNVPFQKWLKTNAGKTYQDAFLAYDAILYDKKHHKSKIDFQFEYNTYIRDFFANQKDKTLKDAITCWNYKKSLPGHHRYKADDLKALND